MSIPKNRTGRYSQTCSLGVCQHYLQSHSLLGEAHIKANTSLWTSSFRAEIPKERLPLKEEEGVWFPIAARRACPPAPHRPWHRPLWPAMEWCSYYRASNPPALIYSCHLPLPLNSVALCTHLSWQLLDCTEITGNALVSSPSLDHPFF